ncbi:MAG: 8-amino-7-oxononanoate synthase [Nocardioides sp.]
MSWAEWLATQADERDHAALRRQLRPRVVEDQVLDLAGNDYLGLSRDPRVIEAAAAAIKTWGAGAGASRLVTGTLQIHDELEAALSRFLGWPAALVFSTGYHANLSVVTALADRHCLIVSDAHIHASLIDAARLSRSETVVVPHNDVAAVERALAASTRAAGEPASAGPRRALVLVESVYSVLGDAAALADLAQVCAAYEALLIVDEAHGVGVAGRGGHGLVREHGLAGHSHVVVTATLSKSLGTQGGVVAGSAAIVEHLINRARPFIFDTGLAPAAVAGAHAALDVLISEPARPELISRRIGELAEQTAVEVPAGAVLSLPMSSPTAALAAQAECLAHGVRVGCFRPPSVPDGISRLRITAQAGLIEQDWARAVAVVLRATGR